MVSKHSIEIIQFGSPYVGRKCPSRRTELKVGDQIVVCYKRDEAFSWNALPALEGYCPYCGELVDFGITFAPSPLPRKRGGNKPSPSSPPAISVSRNTIVLVGGLIAAVLCCFCFISGIVWSLLP